MGQKKISLVFYKFQRPSNRLNEPLERVKGHIAEIYFIGYRKKSRQIINGTFEGAAVARMI